MRLRGFASANGIYDSGLSTINQDGVSKSSVGAGAEVLWGGYGSYNQRRSAFGLDYKGDYRQYTNVGAFNGLNQSLTLTYSNQPHKRLSYDLSALAGTTNRAYGAGAGIADLGTAVSAVTIPTTSLFDLRTNFLGGSGQLTFIHSSRLSTSVSGSGFTVRRRNRLPGVDGVIGRADVAYRLGRRQTIGMDISYYKFDYTNAFGDVNVIDPGVLFSRQFGKRWEFGARVGVMRIESFGTRQVDFTPEIAALLGVGQTSEIFYRRTYIPSGSLRLMRTFKRGSVAANYRNMPSPGNGVLYASRASSFDLGATWDPSRKLSLFANGASSRLTSVTSLQGSYSQYTYGGGLSYRLSRSLHMTLRTDRRVGHLNAGAGVLSLGGTRFSGGITYSPSDIPLQLW